MSPHTPKGFGGLPSHLTFIAWLSPSTSSLPRRAITVCRPAPCHKELTLSGHCSSSYVFPLAC